MKFELIHYFFKKRDGEETVVTILADQLTWARDNHVCQLLIPLVPVSEGWPAKQKDYWHTFKIYYKLERNAYQKSVGIFRCVRKFEEKTISFILS